MQYVQKNFARRQKMWEKEGVLNVLSDVALRGVDWNTACLGILPLAVYRPIPYKRAVASVTAFFVARLEIKKPSSFRGDDGFL